MLRKSNGKPFVPAQNLRNCGKPCPAPPPHAVLRTPRGNCSEHLFARTNARERSRRLKGFLLVRLLEHPLSTVSRKISQVFVGLAIFGPLFLSPPIWLGKQP